MKKDCRKDLTNISESYIMRLSHSTEYAEGKGVVVEMWEALQKHRKAKKYTQAQLAEGAGITQAYVSRLENGQDKNPTKEVIESLAQALGVKAGVLMGEGAEHERVGSETQGND